MIPFVSREDTDFAIHGRIPAAIQDGSLLKRANMPLNAKESHVMICGNPDMVKDTSEVLMNLGFKKNQRREPGQITTENYW
jgi:ferredoxin--NADP+ reductase